MTYQKFTADYLFTGMEMAAAGAVLVTSDNGTVQALLPATEAGEGVMRLSGLLCPGFVNCHCHLELSHMKGVLPEGSGLVDFLLAVMQKRNAPKGWGLQPEVSQAIAKAEATMLDNGIVAVGDICNTTDTVPQKIQGNIFYHNFIETMGFAPAAAPRRMAASLDIFNAFEAAYPHPEAGNSVVPHAPYSVSPALFRMIADLPGRRLLTIHNQETEAENEFCRTGQGDFLRLYQAMGLDTSFFTGTGKRSLAGWLPYLLQGGQGPAPARRGPQPLILVHNVATSAEDLQWLDEWTAVPENAAPGIPSLYFCLCPNANLYINRQLPDVGLFLRHGCSMVVGTDSLASNHQLSILEELKTLQRQIPHLPTATLLQWATLNGAEALQMDGLLGSFSAGKRPGVLLIEDMAGENFMTNTKVRRLA